MGGFLQGKKQGFHQGFDLGVANGCEIGKEIGFYQGFVNQWMRFAGKDESIKPRCKKLMVQIQELIGKFPQDPKDETMQEVLHDLRAKFKQLTAMLRVPTQRLFGEPTNTL